MSGEMQVTGPAREGEPTVLTVAINHAGPIEVKTLAESLQALGSSYARFIEREGLPLPEDDIRLYVREIRSGSILIDLVAVAMQAAVVAEHSAAIAKSVSDFTRHVGAVVDFFRGRAALPPATMDRRDATEIPKVLETVAAQNSGGITFIAQTGATQHVSLVVPSLDAAAVLHRAAHWRSMQALPASGIREKVLFHWHQAQDKTGKAAGDRGVIPTVSERPVKTIFSSDEAKVEMLGEALFRFAYVVDVEVSFIGDKPHLYKVLQVHDRVERDA